MVESIEQKLEKELLAMKDLLALLSPTVGGGLSAGARYALGLANDYDARLTALIAGIESVDPSPGPDTMDVGGASGAPPSSSGRLERMVRVVLSAAEAVGVPCETVASNGAFPSLRELVIHSAQLSDLLIVDSYGPLRPPLKDLVDGALFGSGRPLLLVPQHAGEFARKKIVIAWDASRSAVRAVHDALPLLVRARNVTVVSVVDDKTILASSTGSALCRYLQQWEIVSNFERINREKVGVGTALLAYARQADANLLVMGGFAHGFERELMLGSATRDIYRASLEIPVFLSH
jgi:nucleotide-binding universal stress UspA family protein